MKKLYSDVGIDLIDNRSMSKSYNQQQGKSGGIILGVIAAVVWLLYKNQYIIGYFKNPNENSVEFYIVIGVAIAIILMFTGLGSLFGRAK